MRGILSLWLLILCNLICAQQNIKDDIFVAHLIDRTDVTLEYNSYEDLQNIERNVASLMDSGRYVVSVIRTKESILVFHCTNTEGTEQCFAITPAEHFKSVCNDHFDDGFAITYYNNDGGFAIFDRNPTITKQEVVERLDQKSLKKHNDKGMFVVAASSEAYVLQDRHDGIIRQFIENFPTMYRLQCDSFFTMVDDNCTPAFLTKSYNYTEDITGYTIVYNEHNYSYSDKQSVKEFRSEEQLAEYLQTQQFHGGYRLCRLWGGWTPHSYHGMQHTGLGGSYE